jgi:predicted Zn-dependent protease
MSKQAPTNDQAHPRGGEGGYSAERMEKWVKGEMSLQELTAITTPEMLQMALIGFKMYEQGRYDEAKSIFMGLISLAPDEAYFQLALGSIHLAQDDLDGAERYFTTAIRKNPKEITSYVNRGEVYLRQGMLLEAAADLTTAVKLDPTGKDPLTHRARILAAAAVQAVQGPKSSASAAAEAGDSQGHSKAKSSKKVKSASKK